MVYIKYETNKQIMVTTYHYQTSENGINKATIKVCKALEQFLNVNLEMDYTSGICFNVLFQCLSTDGKNS
jgi:hypothetical protein